MPTILLLIASNVFMTTAWYWHLKGGMTKPLFIVILVSWGLALVEYCFAVPANRLGYEQGWTGAQLKIVQEAISDRKSTRLNSSHRCISYAVFCLKKKTK